MSGRGLRRGQIWWAWLDPVVGSEQAGRRPVVIVSTDDLLGGPTVIVVPLSTRAQEPWPAFVARVRAGASGLPRDSGAWCNHIRSISVERLVRPIGEVPEGDMRAIDLALLYAIGLEDAA